MDGGKEALNLDLPGAGWCTQWTRIPIVGGFSAHADQAQLLAWHKKTGNPKHTFLVHGDEKAMKHFAGLLENTQIAMPINSEHFEL